MRKTLMVLLVVPIISCTTALLQGPVTPGNTGPNQTGWTVDCYNVKCSNNAIVDWDMELVKCKWECVSTDEGIHDVTVQFKRVDGCWKFSFEDKVKSDNCE